MRNAEVLLVGLNARDWLRQKQVMFADILSASLEKPVEWLELDSSSLSDNLDSSLRDAHGGDKESGHTDQGLGPVLNATPAAGAVSARRQGGRGILVKFR